MVAPPGFWGGHGSPYLGEHDVLAPPAQCDTQEVIDGRRIPQACRPVLLLLWRPAQHHVPSSLRGDMVGERVSTENKQRPAPESQGLSPLRC